MKVWTDFGRVRVRDDIKGHGFLIVYTWYAHVQRRLRV